MMTRLATAIIRRYPVPWRERYETEVLSLIEDSPVRAADLGELVRGLIVERARAVIEDADHPSRTATILAWIQPLGTLVLMMLAWGTGALLRDSDVRPQPSPDLGLALMVVWACAFWPVALWRFSQRRQNTFPPKPLFSARTGLVLIPLLFVVVVVAEWSNTSTGLAGSNLHSPRFEYWTNVYRNVFYNTYAACILSAAFWPRRRLLSALGEVAIADERIKWAQRWVDGCHTMISQGVPSPLAEAEAQVDRWSRDRETALSRLQQLGYRARFQS